MAIVHSIKQTTMLGLCLAGHFLILMQIRESGTNLPHTCDNGGTPYQNGSAFECLCPENTIGKRCENMKCSLFECYNNGTLVKKDDYCECICPLQFTGILCENEHLPSKWPDGPYALLMPKSGCPESTNHDWGAGFIHFTTKHEMKIWRVQYTFYGSYIFKGRADKTSTLAGPFKNFSFRLNYCFKHTNSWVGKDTMWPENITVYGDRKGCPPGFDEEMNQLQLPQIYSYWYDGYLPYFEIRNDGNVSLLITKHCHRRKSAFSETSAVGHRNPFIAVKVDFDCILSYSFVLDVEEETLQFESLSGSEIQLSFCVYTPQSVGEKHHSLYPSSWPNGPYALPMLNTGCPEPLDHGWKVGFITHSDDWVRDPYVDECIDVQLLMLQDRTLFCHKYGQQNHKNEIQWPRGSYSILSAIADDCPKGFARGDMTYSLRGYLMWTRELIVLAPCVKRDDYTEFSSSWMRPFGFTKVLEAICNEVKGFRLKVEAWDKIYVFCIYIPLEEDRNDTRYIRLAHSCDREKDCINGADETNCSQSCYLDQSSCYNKSYQGCDGVRALSKSGIDLEHIIEKENLKNLIINLMTIVGLPSLSTNVGYSLGPDGYPAFKIMSPTKIPIKPASLYFPIVQADFSITLTFKLTSDQGEFFSIMGPRGVKNQFGLDLVYKTLTDRHVLRLFYTLESRNRSKSVVLAEFYLKGLKNKWTRLGIKVKGSTAILYKNCKPVVSHRINSRLPFMLEPGSPIAIFRNKFAGDMEEMRVHTDPNRASAKDCSSAFDDSETIGIDDNDYLVNASGEGEEFDDSGTIGTERGAMSTGNEGREERQRTWSIPTQPTLSPDLTQLLETAECFNYEFKCGSGECVKKIHVCDNIKDCQDGSDELYNNCDQKCHGVSFACRYKNRHICINKDWVCDAYADCDESVDEIGSMCNSVCSPDELYVGKNEMYGGEKVYCKAVRENSDDKTVMQLEVFCRHRTRCTRVKDLCDELLPQQGLNNEFYYLGSFTNKPATSCQRAVGLMDGSITDSRLFASSSEEGHQPKMSRPGKNSWCPLRTDTHPYIEVSLNYATVIGGVIIYNSLELGGKTVNKSYIPEIIPIGCGEFSIQYALFQNRFRKYLNKNFKIDESKDIKEPQKFLFLQPFLAKYVRIYPHKTILKGSLCLRMELLGCPHAGIDYPRISLNKLEEVHLLLSLPQELTQVLFPSDKIYMWNINVPDGGYIKLTFLTINLYTQTDGHPGTCQYDMITFDALFEPISAKHNELTPIFPTDKTTLRMTFVSCVREEQGQSSFNILLNKETVPTIWGVIKDSNITEGKLITPSLLGLFVNSQRIQEWILKSDVHGMPLVLTFKSFNIPCYTGYDLYIKNEKFKDENLCNTGRRPRKLYKAWTLQIRFIHGNIVSRHDPEGFSATFRIEPVPEQETWFRKNESYTPYAETGQFGVYTVYSKTGNKHYRFSYRATFDDWVSQAKYCQLLNYSLVVMHDKTELEFLQSWLFYRMKELYTSKKGRLNSFIISSSALDLNSHTSLYVHIGLIRYSGIDGLKDIWDDGTSLSYSAWKTGEPRNISNHKCTGMHVNMTTGEGHWVTVACKEDPVMKQDIMFASICEKPASINSSANSDTYTTFGQIASNATQQHVVRLFHCKSGEWISNLAKCDGIQDCYDGSDEDKCRLNNICSEDMFQCNNGECITVGQVCDHIYDCADKTDEYCDRPAVSKRTCKPTSFQCGDMTCINKTMVCDNIRNCADGSDETNCYTTFNSCFDFWKAGYDKHIFIDRNDIYLECQFKATEGKLRITTFVDVKKEWEYFSSQPGITDQSERKAFGVADFSLFGDTCSIKITENCPEYYRKSYCVSTTHKISVSNNRLTGEEVRGLIHLNVEHLTITRQKWWAHQIKVHPAECVSGPFDIGHYIRCGDGSMVSSSRKCLYDINSAGIIDGCLNFKHLDDCEKFNCSMGYFKCPSSFCLAKRYVCDGEKQCPAGEDEINCWCDDRREVIAVIYNEEIDRAVVPFIHKFARQLYSKQTELYSVRYLYDASEHAYVIRKTLVHPYTEDLHFGEVENFTVFTLMQKLYEEISNIFYKSEGINIINIEQYDNLPLKGNFQNSSFIERVYNIIIDPRLPKRASVTTKERETNLKISEWKILASVGSVFFSNLCQANMMTTCINQFRCLSSKVCIPVDQICDGTPQCPFRDDEDRCDFQCHSKCSCELYIVNCQSGNFTHQDFNNIDSKVRVLNLSENEIFENGTLAIPKNFPYLIKLFAKKCGIESVERETFFNAKHLIHLDLSFNKIEVITSDMFVGLKHLVVLDLRGNIYIESIQPKAFKMFSSLSVLSLTNTNLNEIQTDTFWGLKVNILNISHNRIRKMHSRSFNELSVSEIDFHGNDIETFDSDIFAGIDKVQLKTIRSPAYKFCCIKPDSLSDKSCWPHQDEFSSCEDLMRNSILQTLAWVVGVAAVVANGCTIFYRLYYDRKSTKRGFSMFVTNLAMSDFLMGVYMVIIAVADITFRNRYMMMDDLWRNSVLCKLAGVLATVSSEASVMFMCLITMDRILAIKYPFGQWRFSSKSSRVAMVASWAISLVIALVPIAIPDYFKGRFYSTSGVCLALPLTHRRPPGWLYSFLIYVALNFVAFILIAIGQLVIYLEIKKSSKRMRKVRSQRRNDIRIAKNLLLVLSTDFLCWFPVGIMAIMAANGYVIPGETYAWTAVLVLPVNAALNPFLYTLSAVLQKQTSSATGKPGGEVVSKDFKVQCNIDEETTTTATEVPPNVQNTPISAIRPEQITLEPSEVQCSTDVKATVIPIVPQMFRNTPLNEVGLEQITFEPLDVLSVFIANARTMTALHRISQVYGGFNVEDVLCSNNDKKIRMNSANPLRSGSKGDKQKDVYEFGHVLEHLLRFTKSLK